MPIGKTFAIYVVFYFSPIVHEEGKNVSWNWNILSLKAIEKVKELAVSIEGKSLEEKKSLLAKCAATTLSSKLIGGEKEFFANMVVDGVLAVGTDDRLNMIGIKKVDILIDLSRYLVVEHNVYQK